MHWQTPLVPGLILAIVLAVACSGGDSEGTSSPASSPTSLPPSPSPKATVTEGANDPSPTPVSSRKPGPESGLRIPAVLIEAPVTVKPITPQGQLPNPDNREEVVIYDLSSFSGVDAPFQGTSGDPEDGNVVMSGYYDSGSISCYEGYVPPVCFAVFGSLEELQDGDEVILYWKAEPATYLVNSVCIIDNRKDFGPFLSKTPYKAVTMLVATGNFNEETRGYSHTRVVRAVADPSSPELDCRGETPPTPQPTKQPDTAPSELAVDSLTSPLQPGGEVSLIGATQAGAECGMDLLTSEGRRVLGFTGVKADGQGRVELRWRIPDHYPPGRYTVSASCGGDGVEQELVIE